jgi:hypothetical protein
VNVQATLIIVLLLVLVGLGLRAEWRATSAEAGPAAETMAAEPGFSVTPVADGQYVMRASDKIFYCVNNRCTGIQLITAAPRTQGAAPGATQPAPEESATESQPGN